MLHYKHACLGLLLHDWPAKIVDNNASQHIMRTACINNGEPLKFHRMTRQRLAILDDLQKHRDHPTAVVLYERIRKKLPGVSISTVYRNLEILAETGAVLRIFTPLRTWRFDGDNNLHSHLCCNKCGRVYDLPQDADVKVHCPDCKGMDFVISGYRLDFFGLCGECREMLEKEGQGIPVFAGDQLDTDCYSVLYRIAKSPKPIGVKQVALETDLPVAVVSKCVRKLVNKGNIAVVSRTKFALAKHMHPELVNAEQASEISEQQHNKENKS